MSALEALLFSPGLRGVQPRCDARCPGHVCTRGRTLGDENTLHCPLQGQHPHATGAHSRPWSFGVNEQHDLRLLPVAHSSRGTACRPLYLPSSSAALEPPAAAPGLCLDPQPALLTAHSQLASLLGQVTPNQFSSICYKKNLILNLKEKFKEKYPQPSL